MDPNIIAAGTGLLGVILGAVIGGVFALKATKRQIEVMMVQARGDVNERLYSQSLQLLQFFAENPALRPYFSDNKDLSKSDDELHRMRVLSAAEMVAGFMELVALQLPEQPPEIQPRWRAYVVDGYNSSAVVREHIDYCVNWYADAFLRLLPRQSKPSNPKPLN
jgi:hypothetical protein